MSDIDGDGKPDLITSNNTGNSVSAVKNTSTEGNLSFSPPVDYPVGANPYYVAVGDLDGDSRPDIVAANSSDNAVSILKNIISANISPVITSFTPASGIAGSTVKITGSNFTGATSVKFGGVEAASFSIDSATHITAIVGPGASGDVSVTAANGTAAFSGFRFDGPVITSFTPAIGTAGTIVTISGSNFTNVTDVKFGETSAATFTVNSSTTITATVASGSSGDVTVLTSHGKATLPGFAFGVPTITSFSPASGPAGSAVTITGTNFNKTPSGNIVFFGAVKAKVSSASSTRLEVIVPEGATYLPVSVTTNRLTAYSAQPFIVTFAGDTARLSSHSFSISGNFATGTYPSAVYISDLNGDDKPDLITANAVGNSISILKNTSTEGKISFDAKKDYSTGSNPSKIAVGDLNGDGKPDIVVTNFNSGNVSTISVFMNNSSGETVSFSTKTDLPTGNGSIGSAIYDMNGDGKPDIVVSSGNSGILSVFENTISSPGFVSFAAKKDYTLFGHADNITIADLDSDSKPDIITSNFSDGTISILRNISAGGQLSFAEKIDYPTGINPGYITTGDLDGDGKVDVVVVNYTSKTISFFKNYSNSGFISLRAMQEYKVEAKNIAIADLNGDGKLDLCAGTYNTGVISVLQNTSGNENFSFAPGIDFTTSNYDTNVSVGDIDGDGKPEIAVANSLSNSVSLLKANTNSNIPVITSSSVVSGGKGTAVKLYGSNFTGVTSVAFGGTSAASFTVVSPIEINAVVGGGTSGDITAATPADTAVLAGFKFIPHISTNGPVTLCKDGSVILTSSAAEHNQWLKNGTLISGATARTLTVQTSGSYTVQVLANNILTSSDNNIAVAITVIPTPSISKDVNNNLVSSAATGNQWFLNGKSIPGANNQTYHPDNSGEYTVKDTLNGCASDLSAPFSVKLTGIIDLGNGQYINAYPNPVKNKLNINWNIDDILLLNAEVSDMQGKKWISVTNISNNASVDLSKLNGGIYFMRIFDNQHKINNTIKIIKEK